MPISAEEKRDLQACTASKSAALSFAPFLWASKGKENINPFRRASGGFAFFFAHAKKGQHELHHGKRT
jgi:hypothetical protein